MEQIKIKTLQDEVKEKLQDKIRHSLFSKALFAQKEDLIFEEPDEPVETRGAPRRLALGK